MKKIIILVTLMTALFLPSILRAQNYSSALDYYRLKPAISAKRGTMDFSLTSSYHSIEMLFKVPQSEFDTLRVTGPSTLADVTWNLNYSWNNNWGASLTGISFFDMNEGVYRYGAGDTRLALRYFPTDAETQFSWAMEGYGTLPTGFNDGDRMVRSFAIGKPSWGVKLFTDFIWSKWTAKINGGFFYGNGRTETINNPETTFWYNSLTGVRGITPTGEVVNSMQSSIGFGVSRNFLLNTKVFGEYISNNLHTKSGDGKSVGNIAAGLGIFQRGGTKINLGVDIPLGNQTPNMGFFLNLRMNGIIGGRRIIITPEPTVLEEEPTLDPGSKPFFRREGIVYSRVRSPIHDTVFIIDATPSMLGSNITGPRGEEVASNVIDFIQILIDSTKTNSNISLITFNDELSSLSWRNVDTAKKDEIKDTVRDVPDEMRTKSDYITAQGANHQWSERLEQAIQKAYEELETFKRSDYNRIHLQRIIIFSDGIDESTVNHDLSYGFNTITRRYELNRDDYRFCYYVHTNPKTEDNRIDDNIITFVEQENGKVFRSTDIANEGEEFASDFWFNNLESRSGLRYRSQITKIAVVDFNTKGLGNLRQPLVRSFKSVFEFNEYFVVTPQSRVKNAMASLGIREGQNIDQGRLTQLGRMLGVDYIVYGELIDYKTERGKGLFIPYLFGLPKTEMTLNVAIQLIDVAEGTLAYVETVNASSSHREGINIFPSSRENKLNQLTGLELDKLQVKLMESWARRLRDAMFEDKAMIIEQ